MEYSKLIRINEYLNIEESELKKSGIYNGYVFLDSPLFLNPKLLDNNDIPEFYGAKNIIVLHFENTIKILKNVKEYSDKDVWWKMAKKHFYFPEPEGIGLGTSIDSIDGNGLTGRTAEKCLKTFKSIIEKDIEDSYMYRLLYLVQENIGVDRISDMLCTIIYENLLQFTENKISELKLKCDTYARCNNKTYKIFKRPNGKNLIFMPESFLSEIPDVADEYDILDIINLNQEIKEYSSKYFEEANINITNIKNKTKQEISEMILNNVQLMKCLLDYVGNESINKYDFENDPIGIYKSNLLLKSIMDENMSYIDKSKCESLHDVVKTALEKYTKCIEDLGLNEELYYITKNGIRRPKSELTAHRFFIIILEAIKQYNKFEYFFEAKAGNGQVEFTITNIDEKILVEFKLNTNNLVHGYVTQLEKYIKRYDATSSFYVIIKVATNQKVEEFLEEIKSYDRRKEVVVIDGLIYPSPSKL